MKKSEKRSDKAYKPTRSDYFIPGVPLRELTEEEYEYYRGIYGKIVEDLYKVEEEKDGGLQSS